MRFTYEERREFMERRKRILEEFTKTHPEGFTAENLKEAKAFFKKREREIKREENES
jgi:hypothetical protein